MPTRKVLVIDDEDSTRTAVRFMLEDCGYEVSEAPNGLVGLELLRAATEPMVVLLDLMMPGMSGLRLLQLTASEPELAMRHEFVLFTAARAFTAADLALYLPTRRLAAVPKPFDMDELIATVDQAAAGQLVRDGVASQAELAGQPGAPGQGDARG